ncbi:hypothetical protein HELRODRAFT_179006 [Helobdella robusta]|uniref:ATPase dynein-related AAA domain-containing protein n=1 Tax=Helobdella robusta TaxID=6412 RepID=T1FE15_HELRO|nr:hypothetical protein HELRODRAFT_179006 [Helobdella robusta]ESN95820.1 hypothetical protein HELRODRAFT_179006 [Helobdella robusta]
MPPSEPESLSQTTLSHLRWIMQKDLLGQDVFLIGPPGSFRRNLAMMYLEVVGRECEYISLSRDVTDNDLKQRREITRGSAVYVDQFCRDIDANQVRESDKEKVKEIEKERVRESEKERVRCAVRAAIEGRVLILEGIEKAERNVLPVLNNLLENREMQLDDGRFLMAADRYDRLLKENTPDQLESLKLVRVDPNFRVIALGLPVPRYRGNPLDPPLRSRFQARDVHSWENLELLKRNMSANIPLDVLTRMLSVGLALTTTDSRNSGLPDFPVDNLACIPHILRQAPDFDQLKMFKMMYPYTCMLNKEGQNIKQIRTERI